MAPPIGRSEACISTATHHRNVEVCFKDANGNGKLDAKDTATVRELDQQGNVLSTKSVSVDEGLATAAKEKYLGAQKPDFKAGAEAMRQLVNGKFQASRGEDPSPALEAAQKANATARGKSTDIGLGGELNTALFESFRTRALAAAQKGDLAGFDKEYAAFKQEFGLQTEKYDGRFNDYDEAMTGLRTECRFNVFMNQAMEKARAGADWGAVFNLVKRGREIAKNAEREDLVARSYNGSKDAIGFTQIRATWAAAHAKATPTKAVGSDK